MSQVHEQEEIEIIIDYKGSYFKTVFNKKGKYYYCPICGSSDKSPIFFKEEDLIAHMLTHFKQ